MKIQIDKRGDFTYINRSDTEAFTYIVTVDDSGFGLIIRYDNETDEEKIIKTTTPKSDFNGKDKNAIKTMVKDLVKKATVLIKKEKV